MMLNFDELLSLPIFSNSPLAWSVAIAVAVGAFVVLLTVRRVVRAYQRKFEQVAAASLVRIPLQVLSRTTLLFFVVLALFAGSQVLELGSIGIRVLVSAITIALFWQAGIWAVAAADGRFQSACPLRTDAAFPYGQLGRS